MDCIARLSIPMCLLWLHGATVRADDLPVDLELVLAVDISRSMDFEEQMLQRGGYVAAIRHPEVLAAIASGRHKRIAIAYVEWADKDLQFVRVPWTLINGTETAAAFAARLEHALIDGATSTSISMGLRFSAALFHGNGFESPRQVIDVSGDGPNNQGPQVEAVRDEVVAMGIVINGLPIMLGPVHLAGFSDGLELDNYYEDCVIGGTGAFIVAVEQPDKLTEAIRRKLVQEIAGAEPRVLPATFRLAAEKADCLIGEKLRHGPP